MSEPYSKEPCQSTLFMCHAPACQAPNPWAYNPHLVSGQIFISLVWICTGTVPNTCKMLRVIQWSSCISKRSPRETAWRSCFHKLILCTVVSYSQLNKYLRQVDNNSNDNNTLYSYLDVSYAPVISIIIKEICLSPQAATSARRGERFLTPGNSFFLTKA